MPLKIVRNDITKMNTEAVVNTANKRVAVGTGCDKAIYEAAGREALLKYREENIGERKQGDVFLTPGFNLPAKYIIHAVSPLYEDGMRGEERKLRGCYRKSLELAKSEGIRSVSFPLISTGFFGYPREEAFRIAVDEIHAFLLKQEMEVYLVVFDPESLKLGERISPGLASYIDRKYVEAAALSEYTEAMERADEYAERDRRRIDGSLFQWIRSGQENESTAFSEAALKPPAAVKANEKKASKAESADIYAAAGRDSDDFEEVHQEKLKERIRHLSDTYSEYLMYLIESKGMKPADVWRRGLVDRKIFSKIKMNPDYHPNKLTALCLCIGAMLNLDESKDLLLRAGYALSPSDKTDVIFSYFIENEIYDMVMLDIELEEYGLPCIIG